MIKEIHLQTSPAIAAQNAELVKVSAQYCNTPTYTIKHVEIVKRSIDARQKNIKINLSLRVYINEDFNEFVISPPEYAGVSGKEEIAIIGAGPAGLFAALRCIEVGKKPVVLERGKDVKARRRDLRAINIEQVVNENSNYCFGEGGAGTYSDGKLYTRSTKRGDVLHILKLLVAFGASKDILIEAHPHIGTNKLPAIIEKIRNYIIEHGGEVHFNTRVTDILLNGDHVTGVKANDVTFKSKKVILATGHSARDIFELLHNKGIAIEAKPFALGVRVEHPQTLIDSIQYHCANRGEYLPPSSYSVVRQVNERGVYSFCMCPGGVIAPCATSNGEVVTNGWSPSKRDQPFANSGIVVELRADDFKKYSTKGALAGLYFQKEVEQTACAAAGGTQQVPAQRLVDFTNGKQSKDLPRTSYKPGIVSVEMKDVLPDFIYRALQGAFKEFGKSMKGYLTNDAVVHAPESRTSSPVRIPRDKETLEHTQIKGLYPCGEGAGYAGGIISAAIDGQKCAERACAVQESVQ